MTFQPPKPLPFPPQTRYTNTESIVNRHNKIVEAYIEGLEQISTTLSSRQKQTCSIYTLKKKFIQLFRVVNILPHYIIYEFYINSLLHLWCTEKIYQLCSFSVFIDQFITEYTHFRTFHETDDVHTILKICTDKSIAIYNPPLAPDFIS